MSALVEARLIESDAGALVFLINRSHYDYEPHLEVEGYQPEDVVSSSHSVTHVRLRPA